MIHRTLKLTTVDIFATAASFNILPGGFSMKITNVKDPEALFAVIDSCEGTVELVTGEGDRLNLKSKLCQLVSLASIFSLDLTTIP